MPIRFPFLFLALGLVISGNSDAWSSTGKVVYFGPATISERCLVPADLYKFDEDVSFICDRFPSDQIFRFTEAIAGTKIELEFHGNRVTGRWYSDNRNLDNDQVSEVLLNGRKFFQKSPSGGKYDEGTIVGTRKGKVIRAKANSEGHAPHLGYATVELRELSNAIEWKLVQHRRYPIGYMPQKEQLLLSLESWLSDRSSLPATLLPCPSQGEFRAAPAAGCVLSKPAVHPTPPDKGAQRP